MFFRLLAAFILIPLVELALLLRLADATNVFTTLLVVIGTGILGSILARREGAMAWHRFRSALASGRIPSREIQDGLMVVFAAALLLTPGLLTDAVGFLMLIPAGRNWIRCHVLSRYIRSNDTSAPYQNSRQQDQPNRRPMGAGSTIDATSFHRTK
ncbi:phage T7 F exclusion suppressor FxsA [Novipirellula aureliae]|uniref:Phage T7 F exclusion suppressor FxsA n=1 Tax=Novipirellula aureliae TaxID=2527966 RepID=A0A5C6E762_9BACT|nr:FxsA family protein [Novipirellula aureliae]TWU43777.1 phage T7 F exclusion suppressor FxsA [Novipirellula aureliae]